MQAQIDGLKNPPDWFPGAYRELDPPLSILQGDRPQA